MADCHVENMSTRDSNRVYGFYLKNPHLYHCSVVNISGGSSTGFYLLGRAGIAGEDTGTGGEAYYCQVSEISVADYVYGADTYYLTIYGFECSAVSSSENVAVGIRGESCF